ncbi:Cell division transmembrane protein [Bartonella clarridgeiae 73]|uniref:Cell division transmembrane protein n=1 Tax=Bartonella clarridgeiae (strain CCUG 45776 / CIP 104772 / 73) TaxID=696125 RepID=E6YGC3_BARC7|nr:DNA translocase FtsK [Bartonella clarridgeiae]WCR55482.1 MAG: DNA translocase FtsK [Bartonella clarridgeiae]CBI75911.1 Cell division transmembrane protein [Bartonella clarridgeiae 73]
MRHLKKKSISTSFPADKSAEGVSKKNSSVSVVEVLSYPAVWKKAFSLGQNVRFTRTPEVEILRRRIETDPVFAKQFKVFAEQKQQRFANMTKLDRAVMEPQLTENEMNIQLSEKKASLYSSAAFKQFVQQTMVTPIEEKKVHHSSLVEVEGMTQKTDHTLYLSNYLSDNAFFECGPFILEQMNHKTSKKEVSVNFIHNEDLLETNSVVDKSITDFYRVLECRFPQFCNMGVSKTSTADMKDSEKASDVSYTESEVIQEIQMCHVESSLQDEDNKDVEKIQDLSVIEAIHETNNMMGVVMHNDPLHVTDRVTVRENAVNVSRTRGEEGEQGATSIPFFGRDSVFVPSFHSVNCDAYKFPPIDLLQEPIFQDGTIISQETLERSAGLLESVLEDFGIKGEIIHVRPGPVVTMYEFEPAAGVKSSRVIGLSDDIARSMSAISARVAVIPGRNVIGIELPNAVRETVYLRELIQSSTFGDSEFKLALALGKGINGEPVTAELAKMPHLLVAGTTGSGKSVAINTMILSILYRLSPEQCRLIMVDPKMLELSIYDGIPHLLTPVVTDPKKAVTALKWAVREMEERYRKMAKLGVRNIDGFNTRIALAVERGETIMCTVQSGFDKESGEILYHEEAMDLTQLPYIVIIVDEMADLMMVAGKEIEGAIQRLAQMARAAGIHLIMATQRPSVDVITGTIKANFPTRISFQVTSKIDSRTILGEQGAETLLGQGDMLHMAGGGRIVRVHGPFVSDKEVESVVAHLKKQGKPDYLATVTDSEEDDNDAEVVDSVSEIVAAGNSKEDSEELYVQAVKIVLRDKKCSTSYIQRRLAIGYNKAASLVERMEEEGIVGAANHVGKREILLSKFT